MNQVTEMNQEIKQIDKAVTSIRRELLRRVGRFDQESAAAWQRAWDQHPELRTQETGLFMRRGQLQRAIGEAEYQALRKRAWRK